MAREFRPIHPDFLYLLEFKQPELIELFIDLREFVLETFPDSNELLYHTHALTAAFSISERFGDAFCVLPIYTNHVNLGFIKGTLLPDPHQMLTGTGNLMRHVAVAEPTDYRNDAVRDLLKGAVDLAVNEMEKPSKATRQTISKIKAR